MEDYSVSKNLDIDRAKASMVSRFLMDYIPSFVGDLGSVILLSILTGGGGAAAATVRSGVTGAMFGGVGFSDYLRNTFPRQYFRASSGGP